MKPESVTCELPATLLNFGIKFSKSVLFLLRILFKSSDNAPITESVTSEVTVNFGIKAPRLALFESATTVTLSFQVSKLSLVEVAALLMDDGKFLVSLT